MYEEKKAISPVTISVIVVSIVVAVASLFWVIPVYSRYQSRMYAENTVLINETIIKQTEQLVNVEKQHAAIRVQEAIGIAESQKLINATLTDRYLQHEAIQAQMKMAGSPNHTQIYIPVGTNGIPLVKNVDANSNDHPAEKK